MTFNFQRGNHRARPVYWLGWFPLLFNPKEIVRKLWFGTSCKYTFGTEDQWDVNKLFGVAATPWGVHKNSIRIGYRFNPDINKFEILAYWYTSGVRDFQKICEVVCFRNYNCKIIVRDKYHLINISQTDNDVVLGEVMVPFKKRPGWFSVLLGPFFGGNRPAPHEMTFKLDKL